MNDLPLVSIIIPVYKVRDYLSRCLESLENIDYPNKEIIFVDDCCPEKSWEVCEPFLKAHPEASIIHLPENGGVTVARMTGFERSSGEYVIFVDSDDILDSLIIRRMVAAALASDADMVTGLYFWVYEDETKVMPFTISGVFDRTDVKRLVSSIIYYDELIRMPAIPLYITGKLYRREVAAKSLPVGEGLIYGEDTLTVLDMLVKSVNKLVCLLDPAYYYVKREGQITGTHIYDLWPLLIKYWRRVDELGGRIFPTQLACRMWLYLSPGVFKRRENFSWWKQRKRFVQMFKSVRDIDIVKKYLWDNPKLPKLIGRHPHFILVKRRLYLLDYICCLLEWVIHRPYKPVKYHNPAKSD